MPEWAKSAKIAAEAFRDIAFARPNAYNGSNPPKKEGNDMKKQLLSIGKMAEINHTTVATLRLYDEQGLLKPRHVDPQTGYRYYDEHQSARLDMISYMKELGMSLGEIASVLEKEDITLIEQILIRKNEQLHAQMRELRMRHNAVERAIAAIERYRKSPTTGTISLEYIDQRMIWEMPCTSNFYASALREYEEMLRNLRAMLEAKGVQQIHSYGVGTSIRQADFEQNRFVADAIFIFGDKQLDALTRHTRMLDSGMYACIYLDSYDDEMAYALRLRDYCAQMGYTFCGDYICEVMTEFNVFDSEKRSMFLRLQVPVQFSR